MSSRSFNKRVWLVLTNIWGNWYIHSRTKLCTPFTACVLLCYECSVILCKFTLFNRHVAGVFTYRNDSSNSTKFWDTESFDQAIFQDFPDHFLSNSRLQNSTREYGIHRYRIFFKYPKFWFFDIYLLQVAILIPRTRLILYNGERNAEG